MVETEEEYRARRERYQKKYRMTHDRSPEYSRRRERRNIANCAQPLLDATVGHTHTYNLMNRHGGKAL